MLFLFSTSVNAQDSDPIQGSNKHFVYFNPGALINLPSGIQFGYDYNFFKRSHFDIQGGILVFAKDPKFNDFAATDKRGMRFQLSQKNYFESGFYIGPMILFKSLSMNEKMWMDRYDAVFRQVLELKRYRKSIAFGLDLGWEYKLENGPFFIEIGYGIGFQKINISYDNIPEDATFSDRQSSLRRPGSTGLPFFNFSVKVKYPLDYKSR